jgi:hypothetical protein
MPSVTFLLLLKMKEDIFFMRLSIDDMKNFHILFVQTENLCYIFLTATQNKFFFMNVSHQKTVTCKSHKHET